MRQVTRGWLLGVIVFTGCSGAVLKSGDGADDSEDLTSVGGTTKQLDWDSFVYVAPDADTATIQAAIARQVKSSLGSLREVGIGISDRAALHNLDPAGWTRDTLARRRRRRAHDRQRACACATTTATRRWCRRRRDPARRSSFTMLFGDYARGTRGAAAGVRRRSHRRRLALVPLRAGAVVVPVAHQRRDTRRSTATCRAAAVAAPQIPASDAERRFVGRARQADADRRGADQVSRVRPAVGLRLAIAPSSSSTRSSASSRTSATRTISAPSSISASCARCAAKLPEARASRTPIRRRCCSTSTSTARSSTASPGTTSRTG